ncbi:hypothetical protein L6452_17011 [Arctium lappa]|uniref:Uncharacterized protein n=1 Tax=Arctium lappa TaxID=4217 RepID=A0ACB9C278_ARCLA|nr:hypothetical protein L6452_17011 [Arctium lappa]
MHLPNDPRNGKRRYELWHEKVFPSDAESTITLASKNAMEWGVLNESTAIEKYKTITGREVSSLGFATHSEGKFDWIGASPDGLLGCFPNAGILEVKCPYNKGKPDSAMPWTNMPFYYMPQVQGQMEVMDRDWVDLYCWTANGSTIFRVCRDQEYWKLIHGILREFWWENVVPAKEALVMGSTEEAKKPCRIFMSCIKILRVVDSPFNKKRKENDEPGRTRTAMKSIFTLTWMKNLGRKSDKNQPST